jgi:Glycosyl transferase family 2
MSVTAIIPTYNRAGYLRESLSSVLGQTRPPDQLIVVDDGSSDNTREVVAEFGSRVEYIWKPNGGKSSALNLGLEHATGDLIWIFDDDDIAEPDFLHRTVRGLQENPECGFAYGDYDSFVADEEGANRQIAGALPTVKPDNLFLNVLLGGFSSTERRFVFQQHSLVRKSCYDEVGQFDETLVRSQDFEMLIRLAHRFSAVKVGGVAFHLRQHTGNRGSGSSQIPADRVLETWLKNDQKLLTQVYERYELQCFVPGKPIASDLTDEQTFTGLLQRSCIMARKGVWDKAALDLRLAGEIARQTKRRGLNREEEAILRLFFDLSSFAPHTFDKAHDFRRALREIKPAQLRRKIRAAILWPLPFTIGGVLLDRQYTNFCSFLRVYFALATPGAMLRTICSRSFLSAGTDLIRNRLRAHSPRTAEQWTCPHFDTKSLPKLSL